ETDVALQAYRRRQVCARTEPNRAAASAMRAGNSLVDGVGVERLAVALRAIRAHVERGDRRRLWRRLESDAFRLAGTAGLQGRPGNNENQSAGHYRLHTFSSQTSPSG